MAFFVIQTSKYPKSQSTKYIRTLSNNMSAAIASRSNTTNFYSDIMSDVGMKGDTESPVSFSAKSESIGSTVSYFADKRASSKDVVVGIDGMDTMVVTNLGYRNRGIRSSELAASQAWELRQKIQREQEARKQGTVRQQQQAKAYALQKQQEKEAKKQQNELELKRFQLQQSKKETEYRFIANKTHADDMIVEDFEDNTAW